MESSRPVDTELKPYQPRWWLLLLIRGYQRALSPVLGRNCRYLPTCSQYAYEAVDRFGAARGGWLAIRRLGRCHPFREAGYDPVPERETQEVRS